MIKWRIIINITFILIPIYIIGQEKQQTPKSRAYIPKQLFEEKYSPNDSIGYIIRDNDTLIGVENYIKPKGIPVPYEYKDSTFLEVYKKIAFWPIHKDSADSQTMKYWKDDLKIYFSPNITKSIIKDVMKFAGKIDKEVDSLKIIKVENIEDSNYVIYYNTDYEYLEKMKNKKSSDYWVFWNGKNQIERAYIRIVKDQEFSEKLIKQKIKELFFGTLGRFKWQNELACEHYFSNCHSDEKHLTTLDLELLKYHYSYGICKGTSLLTFEEQHRRSKEVLTKDNTKVIFYHED